MKTHKQLKLTKTQHKNLAKLTVFVRDKVAPPKFDITSFFSVKEKGVPLDEHGFFHACPAKEEYLCSTSACFLGYGPLAGLKPRKDESWELYGKRLFGAKMKGYCFNDIYTFLFDAEHKNSKSAAVKRGAYFLMNGLPETESLKEWETPRSFKPDWASIEELANS